MRRRTLLAGLTGLALGAPWHLRADDSPTRGEDAAPPVGSEIAFDLVGADGRRVRAGDFRGRWLIVFFGYTSCPDLCPTALADLAAVLPQLGALAASVQPLFVSLDPERDTPKALRDYVHAFDDHILPLTGTDEQIAAAARAFGVVYFKVPGSTPEDYSFAHSAFMTLVGPEGGLVTRFSSNSGADEIASKLTRLISG